MQNTTIQKALQKLGIEQLNPMQQAVLQATDKQEDLIVLSPTGTGKTLAYMLPLLQQVNTQAHTVQAVVIVPGRELALQSQRVLTSIGGIRSCACYGGRATMHEHKTLKQVQPQVIFATPGRLNDHLDKGNISPEEVKLLIIDEFDKCLDMGFENEMQNVLHSLHKVRRKILLSATDSNSIPSFVDIHSALRINHLEEAPQVLQRIRMYQVRSETKDKLETLYSLLCAVATESTIVFLNHRQSVERTHAFLQERGFVASLFHGGLEQQQREASLYQFENQSTSVLVCTDLASRGLDIQNVKHIIHYHLPETEEAYTHRTGRTARWDKSGNSYFILSPEEHIPAYVETPATPFILPTEHRRPSLPRMATIYIGKGKNHKISKGDILGFLCKKGKLKMSDIGRIDVTPRYSYAAISRNLLPQLLAAIAGEKIKGIKTVIEEVR